MLPRVSDKISECLARASEARESANAATDPRRKADLLDMELQWLRLVESYRFVEQADRFLEDAHARRRHSSAETSAQSGVLVVNCPITGREFSTGILTDTQSLARLPLTSTSSYCPHCKIEHSWWTKDAKLIGALSSDRTSAARKSASLEELLDVLVHSAIEQVGGKARAAFYLADKGGSALHHITGCHKPMRSASTVLR